MNREVRKFRSGRAMARRAALLFAKALAAKRGPFTAALSGGRTPALLFKELAGMRLPWERVKFIMADERAVPLSSPHSNFGAARRALFSKISVPKSNLRAFVSAAAAHKELLASGGPDLVFLGMGADGHTASVFPGSPALASRRLALAVNAPRGIVPKRRLTLTLKAIKRAPIVVLLASGPEKKEMFLRAAAGDRAIPAGRLAARRALYLFYSENAA
jgi:6-phosphogluconolactonase